MCVGGHQGCLAIPAGGAQGLGGLGDLSGCARAALNPDPNPNPEPNPTPLTLTLTVPVLEARVSHELNQGSDHVQLLLLQ